MGARRELFKFYLQDRPTEDGLAYPEFAERTAGFVASDINLICDDAARRALKRDVRISSAIVFETIAAAVPSVTAAQLEFFDKEDSSAKRKIGFDID